MSILIFCEILDSDGIIVVEIIARNVTKLWMNFNYALRGLIDNKQSNSRLRTLLKEDSVASPVTLSI
jgi:hypothetical protein